MPSTIIGSSEWNTRGIVLSSQSAQEQVNGLVNVQVQYAIPASKQYQIDRMFYVDAPPPIWPTVVNRAEMLTNNLYMVQRTINRANGLVIVNAEYVSGLKRAGFRGYFLRESVERAKKALAYNYTTGPLISVSSSGTFGTVGILVPAANVRTPAPFSSLREATYPSGFVYDERIKTVEFVKIAGQAAAILPTFTRSDLSSLLSFTAGGASIGGSSTSGPLDAANADIWKTSGPAEAYAAGLLSFEKNTAIPYTESWDYVTPSVQVVTLIYRLSR